MQTNTMKARFQIVECSLPYAKKQKKKADFKVSNHVFSFFY